MVSMFLPPAGKRSRTDGQILDATAFAQLRSYCVDVSSLPETEAYEVNSFVEEQSKRGRLLTKIPWKLYPDCREASPDAIIQLQFPMMNVISTQRGQPLGPDDRDSKPYRIKAVLLVLDAESSRVIYRRQADPLEAPTPEDPLTASDPPVVQRRNAMYGAFWSLTQDVQQADQAKER
jgi:hypothetical protein